MNNVEHQMTPAEALHFLDTACSSVAMGRPAHIKGIQAVQILKQCIPVEPSENTNGSKPLVKENATTD